jgi:hypothetical protein
MSVVGAHEGVGAKVSHMIGVVWHFWIGVALTVVTVLACVGVVVYYMLSVQSKKYPGGKQRRHQDL